MTPPVDRQGKRRTGLRALILGSVVASIIAATGCASSRPAPVVDRTGKARAPAPKTVPSTTVRSAPARLGAPYTVRKGDTLYAIAFRLGIDYQALARRNRITEPYAIFPGQVLATDVDKAVVAAEEAPKVAVKTSKKTPSKTTRQPPSASIETSARPSPPAPVPRPSAKSTPAVTPPAPVPAKPVTQAAPGGPVDRWRWPSEGRVTRGYSDKLHKGIDIAGQRGSPVRAVAAGVVVYAGTGVTGYGALLIIKHNEDFLSAYGHNDALLVGEGVSVEGGQSIARMGSTGTDSVKLHFEIRRRGQPVDPLKLLPSR